MILLVIVRRAFCEMCGKSFDLQPEEKPPLQCPHCKSLMWMWGPVSEETRSQAGVRKIRQGYTKAVKVFDKGARARNRQVRVKAQWRQFKPKPIDGSEELQ